MSIRVFCVLLVGAGNTFWPAPILAQTATTAAQISETVTATQTPQTTASPNELEEITVTAQRRSENLERTPVAVSVLSGNELAEQRIVTESDLQNAVPGITVRESLFGNQLNYSIRGQTVDAFSSSRPAVLPYVNEIQVGGPGGSSAFYDLQSIQVLKGPQGTLFGRNATGGAVLFTTVKPSDTLGGYFAADGGNYNERKFEGAINVPIMSDTVLARVAGFYQKRDGFQYNLFTGSTVGDVDRYGARASLTIKFSDHINNDLVFDYAHAGGSSETLVLSMVAPVSGHEPPIPSNVLYTPALDTAIGVPGAWARFIAANPKLPAGGIFAALAQQNARGPFTIDVNNADAHKANNTLLSNITTVDISDNTQFKNVFGYSNLRSRDGEDPDGSPFAIDGTPTGQNYGFDNLDTQYSEEAQLIGKTLAGSLSYVVGAYYSNEKSATYLLDSLVDLNPISPPSRLNTNELVRDKSYAGYGQGTYDLSQATGVQGLSVTAGARYTTESVSMTQLPGSSFFDSSNPLLHQVLDKTFDKVSWQFGLQEQVNSDLLVYAVTRRSFRSGGFNTTSPPVEGFGNNGGAGFDAEIATDAELGLKFQGMLGPVPTRLNVAAFLESIKNAQRVAYTAVGGIPAAVTTNVPKTRVSGFEAEGQVNPTAWLKLGASLAYTDAKFTDNQVTVPGSPAVTVGFGPYPDTPRWSGSVFSEVTVPVSKDVSVSLRGQLYDQTSTFYSSTNNTLTPGTELPGYAVTDFTLSLTDSKTGWSAAAIVKNAFNRVYYVGGFAGINLFATNGTLPGAPRTIVGEVRYKF
jgi:iron complex outermembrane receptor protein